MAHARLLGIVLATCAIAYTRACHSRCRCENVVATCAGQNLGTIPHNLNPFLEHLNLSRTSITSTRQGMDVYTHLVVLDLSYNQIETLEHSPRKTSFVLAHLNLSHNLIKDLKIETFTGMKHLKELFLSHNQLTFLPDKVFRDLNELEVIDLRDNALSRVSSGALSGLENLRELYLSGNKLTTVPFPVPKTLNILDLSRNHLGQLRDQSFSGLVNLETLDISSCNIHLIFRNAFRPLRSLLTLRLSDNILAEVPSEELQELSKLDELILGKNPFRALHSAAFKRLRYLRRLEICDSPNLERVDKNAFIDNPNIIEVDLSKNLHLWYIDPDVFQDLRRLKKLSLSGCKLGTLGPLPLNLDELDLRGNPLVCNCSLSWLNSGHLSNRTRALLEETRCVEPLSLQGQQLLMLSEECSKNLHPGITIAVWIGIAGALLVVIGLLAIFLYRQGRIPCFPRGTKPSGSPSRRIPDVEEEFILQAAKQYSMKLTPVTEL